MAMSKEYGLILHDRKIRMEAAKAERESFPKHLPPTSAT
jgi:hypothetical protein